MSTIRCADLRAWLEEGVATPLPAELLDHSAGCELCRGALLLTLSVEHPDIHAIDCDECQHRLPEFIEWGREGVSRGFALIPMLVHMSTCAECHEIYRVTMTLIAAEQVGALSPPPRLTAAPTRSGHIKLLTLARDMLNLVLPIPADNTTVARGIDESKAVIAETRTERGFSISVSVDAQRADEWIITITLIPAPAGWVEVQLGNVVYRSPLGSDGAAQIPGVPAALLSAHNGPPLEVAIEQVSL